MPAPGIVFRRSNHPGANRVQMNVADKLQQVCIRVEQQRLVPSLENVPRARPCQIDPLRVPQRDVLHDAREGDVTNLDDQVEVIGHETEAVYPATEFLHGILQDQVEPVPVPVAEKDRFSGVASKDDMVDCTGILNAGFTCHTGR